MKSLLYNMKKKLKNMSNQSKRKKNKLNNWITLLKISPLSLKKTIFSTKVIHEI